MRDALYVDELLGALREACAGGIFTVKMRIGFEDDAAFEIFLDLINKHKVDLLTVHGRTVREMYRSEVRYPRIRDAVQKVVCPVMANGNVTSADKAVTVINDTGAHGVMIGRSAIRNPWIFSQTRARFAALTAGAGSVNLDIPCPTLADVRDYVQKLWDTCHEPGLPEKNRVARMKKYLNFVGLAVDEEGRFLHEMRRAVLAAELFDVCDRHLIANGRASEPFPEEPFKGLVARPSRETEPETCRL